VIKSWMFDSSGSTGEASWRRAGDRWVVESSIVMPNGQRTTTHTSYKPTGPQSFEWSASEAGIGAEQLPSQQVRFRRAVDE
jgi:hypothetical protein